MARRIRAAARLLSGTLALVCAGSPVVSATARSARAAPPAAPSLPANDHLAGFDTLEDPADRGLPFVGLPRVHVPGRADLVILEDSRQRAARERLGPAWRLTPVGGSTDSWILRGPAVRLPEGAGARALRRIVADLPELFELGAADRLEPVFDRASGPSGAVRMRQVVDGARVAGGDVIATFDGDGRLVGIASSYRAGLPPPPAGAIGADAAKTIARADLLAALPDVQTLGAARAEAWIWPLPTGEGRVWLVHQTTRRPWGRFTTRIDAATGAVLARENAVQSKTRVGKGIVYRSNADYPNRTTSEKLPALQDGDVDPAGHLDGMHVSVLDEKGSRVASETLQYLYYPFEQWDAFDQVSAYYHLERAHTRFAKVMGVRGLPWFDGPEPVKAIANVRELCDAYYSTDLQGDGKPGFAFGDQVTCPSTLNEDFARDSDVVYHEYTHAIVDWQGIGLQEAPVNSYQRALAEADADYHAAKFTDDPVVGDVVGFPRNVANAKTYPVNVGCSVGFPEEHCTGEIWSGLLWELGSYVRNAEKLEFASLDYLIDHPDVSHVPVWLDFWDATLALIEADHHMNGGRHAGVIYGLAASRGILGPATWYGDQLGFLYQVMDRGTRFKSVGRVHDAGAGGVPFYFSAPSGSTVSIKVKSTSGLHPDFLVGEALGYPLEYFTAAATKNVEQAALVTALPPVDGIYVVTVRGADATNGTFQISIVVKN